MLTGFHSLRSHLHNEGWGCGILDEIPRHEFDNHMHKFDVYLNRTLVKSIEAITPHSLEVDENLTYQEYVECILERKRLMRKERRVFVAEKSTYCDEELNFFCHPFWEWLSIKLGRTNFSKLIIGTSMKISRPEGFVSFDTSGTFQKQKSKHLCVITRSKMYYRSHQKLGRFRLLDNSPNVLLQNVLHVKLSNENAPRKYRRLKAMLSNAIRRERQIAYQNLLCVESKKPIQYGDIFMNATNLNDVRDVVLQISTRVFPNAFFGNRRNSMLIRQIIMQIIESRRVVWVDLRNHLHKFQLSSVSWLGKSRNVMSAQDYALRLNKFTSFLQWFFESFVVKLIGRLWYVTESNASSPGCEDGNKFFPHHIWRKISGHWIQDYTKEHLYEVEDSKRCSTSCDTGYLRLLPKKNDFRPLCVPQRTTAAKSAVWSYASYISNVIRPMKQILRSRQDVLFEVRSDLYPKCKSVNDVCKEILKFKTKLALANAGRVPKLFCVQFDMRHSFDNLNQAKIFSCVKRLFESDSECEEYTVKRSRQHELFGKCYGKPLTSVTQRGESIQLVDVPSDLTARKNVQFNCWGITKLTQKQIIEEAKKQVLETSLVIPDLGFKRYRRTTGLFQGLPLLGILCDLVYDFLVSEVFMMGISQASSETLILRLVDDFLVISTNKMNCESILQRASSTEAGEYGAFLNKNKIKLVFSDNDNERNLNFLGLKINIVSLDVLKDAPDLTCWFRSRRSCEFILNCLQMRFGMKLRDSLFDLKHQNIESVKQNLRNALTNTIKIAIAKVKTRASDEGLKLRLNLFFCHLMNAVLLATQDAMPFDRAEITKYSWDIITTKGINAKKIGF